MFKKSIDMTFFHAFVTAMSMNAPPPLHIDTFIPVHPATGRNAGDGASREEVPLIAIESQTEVLRSLRRELTDEKGPISLK